MSEESEATVVSRPAGVAEKRRICLITLNLSVVVGLDTDGEEVGEVTKWTLIPKDDLVQWE
jgi:hypothetical protein